MESEVAVVGVPRTGVRRSVAVINAIGQFFLLGFWLFSTFAVSQSDTGRNFQHEMMVLGFGIAAVQVIAGSAFLPFRGLLARVLRLLSCLWHVFIVVNFGNTVLRVVGDVGFQHVLLETAIVGAGLVALATLWYTRRFVR